MHISTSLSYFITNKYEKYCAFLANAKFNVNVKLILHPLTLCNISFCIIYRMIYDFSIWEEKCNTVDMNWSLLTYFSSLLPVALALTMALSFPFPTEFRCFHHFILCIYFYDAMGKIRQLMITMLFYIWMVWCGCE